MAPAVKHDASADENHVASVYESWLEFYSRAKTKQTTCEKCCKET